MLQAVRGHWQLGLLTTLIAVFWFTPMVTPLKILVVFMHEISHVVAALLTGGSVESLTINPHQGGMVITRGGSRFLTLNAGYTGSLLFGVVLVLLAVRTRWDRIVLGGMGALLLVVTGLYVRDLYAVGFALTTGMPMLATARFLPRDVNDLILRTIGLTSMIYVPIDIYSDTIIRPYLRSDARMLAEEFGGATLLWGGLWMAISLVVIAVVLRRGLGRDSNIRLQDR